MKFPHVTQLESNDCGPACLKMIIRYYGKDCELSFLADRIEITRMGVTLGDLARLAESVGFETVGVSATLPALRGHAALPCILHWRSDHYVVLYKITANHYYLSDPAHGRIRMRSAEFEEQWIGDGTAKGLALFLQPNEDFQGHIFPKTGAQRRRNWSFYRQQLTGYYHYSILLLILLGMSSLLGYIFPQTLKMLIDQGVQSRMVSVIWLVLAFQLALAFGQIILQAAENWIRVKLSMGIGIKMMTELLFKLIQLPIRFFDMHVPADIYQRIEDQSRIERFLSERFLQMLFSGGLSIVLLIRIFKYQVWLGLGLLAFTLLSVWWIIHFNTKRKQLDYTNFYLNAKNRNLLGEMLAGMIEIKMNNAQNKKASQWLVLQDQLYSMKKKILQVGIYQSLGVQVMTQIKNIGGNIACSWFVMQGHLTFGEMVSIGYIIGMLSVPLDELVLFFQSLQEAQMSMDRLEVIRRRENEMTGHELKLETPITAGFSLRNVYFKYTGSFQPFVLHDLSAQIEKGKVTAIVGESGSGKTSLLKLLLGFYSPQQGEIYLDGQRFDKIDYEQWRNKCGVVMQDGYLFSGTIADNISVFEEHPPLKKLRQACEIACIDDFIRGLPMGFQTKIGNIGTSISGGQKQRLLIARAVYKDPEFIFFDEATSSLDASNERRIVENLQAFFRDRTVVIVAHRLSTVKNADKIIVLENGQVREMGSHWRLTQEKGLYFSLIRNQLELGN